MYTIYLLRDCAVYKVVCCFDWLITTKFNLLAREMAHQGKDLLYNASVTVLPLQHTTAVSETPAHAGMTYVTPTGTFYVVHQRFISFLPFLVYYWEKERTYTCTIISGRILCCFECS